MKVSHQPIKKVMKILNARHRRRFWQRLRQLLAKNYEARKYQKWIRQFDTLTDKDRENIFAEIENFKHKPLVSIVLPVYNVEERWLRLCIESVLKQLYENWEFCIADDCSPSPRIRRVLEEYAKKDRRIKVVFRTENGHISAASNSALELASGEFVAFLDHDDELAEHALFCVVKEINDFPEAEMIYTDEDMIDEKGNRYTPKFKPDWSRDFFYSLNLVTHLSVYKTSVLRKIGGFRIGLEGSQDYDLALRAIEQIPENHIRHVPKILYHWRAIKGSVALSNDEKPYAHERARLALRSHFERTGKSANVTQTVYNLHRVQYELPKKLPKVSLILSTDEDFQFTKQAIKTFIGKTEYQNFEIVLICSEATKVKIEAETFSENLKIIISEIKSGAEKYNSAVSQTDGEILCFVDANLKPESKDWLNEMTGFALQKEIGAVGAKILDAHQNILHAGLIVGAKDSVGVAHDGLPHNEDGYFVRAKVVNNFSAISISCLAARREVFQEAGGFDAENFPNALFDVDFCLKLREKNHRIVFTPYAELVQIDKRKLLNAQKKPTEKEAAVFKQKWRSIIGNDSFYNPNLSYKDGNFSIKIQSNSDKFVL